MVTHSATCPAYEFCPLAPVCRSVGEGGNSSATAEKLLVTEAMRFLGTVSIYQRAWETRALRVVCGGDQPHTLTSTKMTGEH